MPYHSRDHTSRDICTDKPSRLDTKRVSNQVGTKPGGFDASETGERISADMCTDRPDGSETMQLSINKFQTKSYKSGDVCTTETNQVKTYQVDTKQVKATQVEDQVGMKPDGFDASTREEISDDMCTKKPVGSETKWVETKQVETNQV